MIIAILELGCETASSILLGRKKKCLFHFSDKSWKIDTKFYVTFYGILCALGLI